MTKTNIKNQPSEEPGLKNSLATLGLKPLAQEVFIYLYKNGISPAVNIAFALGIPKSSVYDALAQLLDESLITEFNEDKNKTFTAIDNTGLEQIIFKKIENIKKAGNTLLEFATSQKPNNSRVKPKIKFYFGQEGIRQAFRDTAWNDRCDKTYLMWPTTEMIDVLTPEFSVQHSSQRLKYNVYMNVIRAHTDRILDKKRDAKNQAENLQTLLESEAWNKEIDIRYTPKEIKWDMSFWVYDNKCLCASGGEEGYAFVVHSKEFADLMITLWKQMWNICKK